MEIQPFSFGPAVFCGNPGHAKNSQQTIVDADAKFSKLAGGKVYLPEIMRLPGFGQMMVRFHFLNPTDGSIDQVKVFCKN